MSSNQGKRNDISELLRHESRFLLACTAPRTDVCNIKIDGAFALQHNAVVFLSCDAKLPEASLALLSELSATSAQCLIGCQTVDANQPRRLQLPGWNWSATEGRWTTDWMIRLKAIPDSLAIERRGTLSPEAMVIPRDAWRKVGPFDTHLTVKHAVIDWCRRAHAAGFPCLEVRDARVLVEYSATQDYDAKIKAYLAALPDTLYIAKKYGLPMSRFRLIIQLLRQSISEEVSRVRFRADYGFEISSFKRVVWYAKNVLQALTRDRVLSTVRHAALSYFPGLRSHTNR